MLRVFETIATYDRDIKAGFSIELDLLSELIATSWGWPVGRIVQELSRVA
mgnify:CR=1 FL=1